MVRECIKCRSEVSEIASICSGCVEDFLSENIFGMAASPLISSPPMDRYREDSDPFLAVGERPEGEVIFEPGKKVQDELNTILEDLDYDSIENKMNIIMAELGVSKDIDFDNYLFSKKDTKVLSQLYYKLEELEHEVEKMSGEPNLYLRIANLFYYSYRCADTSLFELDARKSITNDYKEKAEGYYEFAAQKKRESIYPLKNRAFLLMEEGELESAESYFRAALSIDSKDLETRAGLAGLLLKEKRLEEAEIEIEKIMDEFEEDPHIWFLKGELYRKKDAWGRAIQFYNKSEDHEEEFIPALISRAYLFLEHDMVSKAMDDFEKVLESDDENIQALEGLGLCFEKKGKGEEAIRYINEALTIDSHREDIWVKRGEMLQKRGDHEEAVKDFSNALEIDKGYRRAIDGKNKSMKKLGED